MKQLILIAVMLMFAGSAYYLVSKQKINQFPDVAQSAAVSRKLTAEEARDMMEAGESYILLDVRTEEEFREKRIEGAVLIPDHEIAERAEAELPDRDARILVYCRSGRRSALAAEVLVGLGYTEVYDFGGINDWSYETIED